MIFEELSKEKNSVVEKEVLKAWKKNNIFKKSIENRENNKTWVFYDGPATANGKPGIHHMVAKELKDVFCRYKTMRGYKVLSKVGWDTHGLPVEVQVEKQLGFSGKKDIEEYGIEKFNQKCRESVWENETAFRDLTDKMGQFIDIDNPYITYDNNFNRIVKQLLQKEMNKRHSCKLILKEPYVMKKAKELKDAYQKMYGPLTMNYPCKKWRWLEEPWPWERGNY